MMFLYHFYIVLFINRAIKKKAVFGLKTAFFQTSDLSWNQ